MCSLEAQANDKRSAELEANKRKPKMHTIKNGSVTFINGAVFTCAELKAMFGSVDEGIATVARALARAKP